MAHRHTLVGHLCSHNLTSTFICFVLSSSSAGWLIDSFIIERVYSRVTDLIMLYCLFTVSSVNVWQHWCALYLMMMFSHFLVVMVMVRSVQFELDVDAAKTWLSLYYLNLYCCDDGALASDNKLMPSSSHCHRHWWAPLICIWKWVSGRTHIECLVSMSSCGQSIWPFSA